MILQFLIFVIGWYICLLWHWHLLHIAVLKFVFYLTILFDSKSIIRYPLCCRECPTNVIFFAFGFCFVRYSFGIGTWTFAPILCCSDRSGFCSHTLLEERSEESLRYSPLLPNTGIPSLHLATCNVPLFPGICSSVLSIRSVGGCRQSWTTVVWQTPYTAPLCPCYNIHRLGRIAESSKPAEAAMYEIHDRFRFLLSLVEK